MKLFKKKTKVQNENWKIWDFLDEEDFYGLITFDVSYIEPSSRKEYGSEVILDLLIPERWMGDGNFPSPEGHSALLDAEDGLISTLEKNRVQCIQVVRLTYDGRRSFVFEVFDLVKFLESVKVWVASMTIFEVKIEKVDAWQNYESMKPDKHNWQQIGNQQVIEQLVTHGSNPEKTHRLEFSFGGDPLQLEKLKNVLLSDGATLLLSEGDLLEVWYDSPLENLEIDPLTHFLLDTATEHSCEYEGWRAAIVK